ncbi:MAG TPA: hypothetical protein VGH28_00880 [Polyangiaceae bacterium]|jgi:hypothetical protein
MIAFCTLFLIGAIELTLLDSVHVHTHTLRYDHPFAFGSAWWVPLLMGSAASFGGLAYAVAWKRLGGPAKVPSWAAIARANLAFAMLYAASGLLPSTALTKLIVLAVGAFAIWREVDGTRAGAKLVAIGAVLGTLAEAINPAFHYVAPDFARVPMWLPALYACATPALGQLARRVTR